MASSGGHNPAAIVCGSIARTAARTADLRALEIHQNRAQLVHPVHTQ
jgi:hypothetical protein